MNNILLIDDREDFAISFIQEANAMSINTSHKRSFNGLKEVLPKFQHNFAAVILDIKCLIKDDQEKEDAGFITVALSYLDMNLPHFPRFILTGDDQEFEKFSGYFKQEKVFLKTPQDLSKLLIQLKECVDNCSILRIKRENIAVFEIFKNRQMNVDAEVQLLKILQNGMQETDFGNFKGILADVRGMQEAVYKTISARNPAVVPSRMFKPNGMIKFNELMKYLNGNPNQSFVPTTTVYQNATICQLSNSLYWSCGEYIHEDPKRTYLISHYALKSLINNLLEILIWSKQF